MLDTCHQRLQIDATAAVVLAIIIVTDMQYPIKIIINNSKHLYQAYRISEIVLNFL